MASTQATRPKKPRPDFPLFPHASGQWAKKIRGRMHYFGTWDDPDAALNAYLDQKDYLHTGRHAPSANRCTVETACNTFLTAKDDLLKSGELSQRHFNDLQNTGRRIARHLGRRRLVSELGPEDFKRYRAKVAKRLGPVGLGNEIQRVRSVFKYAWDTDLIDVPVKFGPQFSKPSRTVIRKAKARNGKLLLEAREIRQLLENATPSLRALILVGINAAMGNTDVAEIEWRHVDLSSGWRAFGRPKTGIERRCPLWPETVDALKGVKRRGKRVFVTKYGQPWVRTNEKGTVIDSVSREFGKLCREQGMKRKGVNFYTLRRTFATVAAETGLQVAVNHIMGHADDSMPAVYRQDVSNEQLRAVTDHVRAWLFPHER